MKYFKGEQRRARRTIHRFTKGIEHEMHHGARSSLSSSRFLFLSFSLLYSFFSLFFSLSVFYCVSFCPCLSIFYLSPCLSFRLLFLSVWMCLYTLIIKTEMKLIFSLSLVKSRQTHRRLHLWIFKHTHKAHAHTPHICVYMLQSSSLLRHPLNRGSRK